MYGHCPYEFFPHTLIVPINQGSMRWTCICKMNLFPEDSSEEGRKSSWLWWSTKEKKHTCHAEGRDHSCTSFYRGSMMAQVQMSKSLFPFVPFIRNLNWSHCGCFHLYSLPSGNVAFYNSFCTWESDSKCVPLLLSSRFCSFSFFESPFRTCLLWKLSRLFQPVEPSLGIEI